MGLRAQAVQVGTACRPCPDARTGAVHRALLARDAARHSAMANVFTGPPARGIVNRSIREIGPMNPAVPARDECPASAAGGHQRSLR